MAGSNSKGVPKRADYLKQKEAEAKKARAAARKAAKAAGLPPPTPGASVATQFQPGNQFWKMRSRHGVKPIFPEGPEGARMLYEACEDYFKWCDDNPLMEEKVFSYEGCIVTHDTPKLRAYTLNGLTLFIDVSDETWRDMRNRRPDLSAVIAWAEKTIREQKFAAAAAGLLNANIISRDLGLADKHEVTGNNGGPIQSITSEMTPEEAADLYAQAREAGRK